MAILNFEPVYQHRIWGGQDLKTSFGRNIPPEPIGESWEICDREDVQTLEKDSGKSLHDLWTGPDKNAIFGTAAPDTERFPLLIKILDAREKLSLQVHPPAELAADFNGEPKTECWYFLETEEDACIYVGLKRGVDRQAFEAALKQGKVAECFHVLPTRPGELMFLPSGRVHAIGGGNIILEIQQNSDTTFRVYDWDRVDAKTGKPRDLHVEQSLACIDFDDVEPVFSQPHGDKMLRCPYFALDRMSVFSGEHKEIRIRPERFLYGFTSAGSVTIGEKTLERGTSFFLTADSGQVILETKDEFAEIITATWPQ